MRDQGSTATFRTPTTQLPVRDASARYRQFGRAVYSEGVLKRGDFGGDHHGNCFTMWLAGAGIKPGIVYGETDDYSFNAIRDIAHVRDLNATILHPLGLDHNRLTFKFEGLDQKLTGTAPAKVITGLLA